MVGVSIARVKHLHRPQKTIKVVWIAGDKVQIIQHDKLSQCSRNGDRRKQRSILGMERDGKREIMEGIKV